jgi:hypothetical protein
MALRFRTLLVEAPVNKVSERNVRSDMIGQLLKRGAGKGI